MSPKLSVIIPTIGRKKCLEDCIYSLKNQTEKDFEIVLVTEEGPLAEIRNEGAKRARGNYIAFIDDDTFCSKGWARAVIDTFESSESIAGVSGPAYIDAFHRNNRDIFRFRIIKHLYDIAFLGKKAHLPGHFTKSGAWTTGASEECDYNGPVEFLEACNMAWRSDVFSLVGGFDTSYKGIGDWSEPDLAFKIRQLGYTLWFNPIAKMEHRPSKSGAFKKRKNDVKNRLANYSLFSRRWIEPCFQHDIYKLFIKAYYAFASIK